MVLQKLVNAVTRRKSKKEVIHIPSPLVDFHSLPDNRLKTILSFPEFAKGPATFSPKVADYDDNAYCDEFDPEMDYAQVLEEARSNADATHMSPDKHSSVQSWLARSPDIRLHDFSLDDAEAVFGRHQADISHSQAQKPSKSWKRLLFWKRSKKTEKFEFRLNAVHSSSTTPMHHMFGSFRTRATVAPSFTSVSYKSTVPKRSTSGPIYYDGTPYTPNRNSRNFSSPLSASATPTRDGLYEPTYKPLKSPHRNYPSCGSPLYTP